MKARAFQVAPLFVAIALHAWASASYPVDAVLVALALVAIPLGGLAPLGTAGARVLMTVAFVAGAGAGWSHAPAIGYGPGTLPRAASLVAISVLLAAIARNYVRDARGRAGAPLVLGVIAVAASGATRLGLGYALFASTYLALMLVALRARDGSRAHLSFLAARHRAGFAIVASGAALLALGFARAVPPLHRAVQRAFEHAYQSHDVVGFGGSAWLGALRNIIRSDEEVLRLAPPSGGGRGFADYLRGAVYDEYSPGGFWTETPRAQRTRLVPTTRESAATAFLVRRISGTASHYFVPLEARELFTPYGSVEVDRLGAILTAGSSRANEYAYVLGDRDDLAPDAPTPADLDVPESERVALERLASAWTAGAGSSAAKLEEIRGHLLAEYAYSLDFLRDVSDPLLDFLFVNKLGYCTYFASAFTLLARASGVPARMVTGYRVAEWSPVAGEYVVRDKNAHAWIEAWTDGAWRTYDATPAAELAQDTRHVSGVWTLASDVIARIEEGATYAVTHVTLAQLFSALAVLLAAWLAVRALQRRRARGQLDQRSGERLDPPLPCFERLVASLAARGVARRASEPLTRFSARLRDGGLPDAAVLVDRYAALRYGGLGERAPLETDVERFLHKSSPI